MSDPRKRSTDVGKDLVNMPPIPCDLQSHDILSVLFSAFLNLTVILHDVITI